MKLLAALKHTASVPPAIDYPPDEQFYWQLQGTVNTSRPELVYDIDGFDNTSETVSTLKSAGKYVIAYFSAGTYENWRPDEGDFPSGVKGNNVDGWAGEKWLDVTQVATLQPIMEGRVAIAKSKGFQAIEWDNLDGYDNSTGFSISQAQQKTYLQMLADITHAQGLAAIFKNVPDFASWGASRFDGVIGEEAYEWAEEASYDPWHTASKPVWIVEYSGTLDCSDAASRGFHLSKYTYDLDGTVVAQCGGTPSGLIGVASPSTSLTDFPKTANLTSGNYYVSNSGSDSNSGTSTGSPFATIGKALSVVADGQTILVRGGTYTLTSRLSRNTGWSTGIKIFGYGNERPIIDGSGTGSGDAGRLLYFQSSARREHWKGFEIRNAKEVSIQIEGQYITIEDVWVHDGATNGILIGNFGGGAGNNLIQDTVVWKLGDGTSTGTNTPDGIAATSSGGSTTTNSNNIVRCLVANAGDDCFDFYRAKDSYFIDCVAIGAGRYWNGNSAGDGNGFKMGGGDTTGAGNNTVRGSFAINCVTSGFNENSSNVANKYYFNSATKDVRGFINDSGTCQDNISYNNSNYNNSAGGGSRNSWNLSNANPVWKTDWSLDSSTSPYRAASAASGPTGASTVALELYAVWKSHADFYNPGG